METSTFEVAVYAFFVTAHATLFDVLPAEFSRRYYIFGNWTVTRLSFSLLPALLVLCAGVVMRGMNARDLLHAAIAIGIVSSLQASFYWDFSYYPDYMGQLTATGMVLTAVMLAAAVFAVLPSGNGGAANRLAIGPLKISHFTLLATVLILFNPVFFTGWIPAVRAVSSGHESLVPEFTSDLGAGMVLMALLIIVPAALSVFTFGLPPWARLTFQRLCMLVFAGLSCWFFHEFYLSVKHL